MVISTSHPYDVTKLIFRTVLATEPRPTIIESNNNEFTIVYKDSEEKINISFDTLNYEYIQKMFLEENGIFEIDEYGKVFYEFGRNSLALILQDIIGVKNYITNVAHEDQPTFIIEYEDEFYKINQNISLLWKNFITKVNLMDLYKDNVTFAPDSIFSIIEYYYKKREQFDYTDMSAVDILISTYGSLLFLITGLIVLVCKDTLTPTQDIFVNEFNAQKASIFIKKVANSTILDNDSKIRFFTLSLCFFNLNRYFRIYSGITYDDPMINVIANIGYAISDLLKEENDFKFIDEEVITGLFGSKASFIGFTSKYDALRNFISYRDNFSIKNDYSVPWVYGTGIIPYLRKPENINIQKDIVDFYTPLITRYIQSNLSLLEYTREEDLSIERSFNFLRDCVSGADIETITTVNPFTFYQIVLIVSSYRYIKNKINIFNKLSDHKKKKIVFGIWLGDSLLYSLYMQWFNSGKFYNQVNRPKYTENLIQSTLNLLKKEVDVVCYTYFEFLKSLTTTEKMKDFIIKNNILYDRHVDYISPKKIINKFKFDIASFPEVIVSGNSALVYSAIAGLESRNYSFDYIISQLKTNIDLESKSSLLKSIAKSKVTETITQDALLDKLYESSLIIDKSQITSEEMLYITTLPILDYIEKMLQKENIGQYFEFIKPDNLSPGSNYEYLLNEEIRNPLSKYESIENMFY